jgi:hypothetical protein
MMHFIQRPELWKPIFVSNFELHRLLICKNERLHAWSDVDICFLSIKLDISDTASINRVQSQTTYQKFALALEVCLGCFCIDRGADS